MGELILCPCCGMRFGFDQRTASLDAELPDSLLLTKTQPTEWGRRASQAVAPIG
jgi:hypothetical protein